MSGKSGEALRPGVMRSGRCAEPHGRPGILNAFPRGWSPGKELFRLKTMPLMGVQGELQASLPLDPWAMYYNATHNGN